MTDGKEEAVRSPRQDLRTESKSPANRSRLAIENESRANNDVEATTKKKRDGRSKERPPCQSRSKSRVRSRDPRQCQKHLREMIGKHEIRNEELERKEGDLRQRLEVLECSMPAVMVWNIWRMAQGAPVSNLHRIIEKQFRGPAFGSLSCPSSPSQHYDCRVREIEAERKQAQRRAEEAHALWSEKEVTLAEQKRKIEEARKAQEERRVQVERLEKEALEAREMLEKAKGDDGMCTTGECGELECRKMWLDEVTSTSSVRSTDLECLGRLQDLAEAELSMKRQIAELERRECAYMRTLQQADELWTKMESDNASSLGDLQEQLDAKVVENQQLAERVGELEDELEKLRKQLVSSQSKLEKFTNAAYTCAGCGGDDDFADVTDAAVDLVEFICEEEKDKDKDKKEEEEKQKQKKEKEEKEKEEEEKEKENEEEEEEEEDDEGEPCPDDFICNDVTWDPNDMEEEIEVNETVEIGIDTALNVGAEKETIREERIVAKEDIAEDREEAGVLEADTVSPEANVIKAERAGVSDVGAVKESIESKGGSEEQLTNTVIETDEKPVEREDEVKWKNEEGGGGGGGENKEVTKAEEIKEREPIEGTTEPDRTSTAVEAETQFGPKMIDQIAGGQGANDVAEIDPEAALKHLAREEVSKSKIREAVAAEAEHADVLTQAAESSRLTKEKSIEVGEGGVVVPSEELSSWRNIAIGVQKVITKCPDCSIKRSDTGRLANDIGLYLGIEASEVQDIEETTPETQSPETGEKPSIDFERKPPTEFKAESQVEPDEEAEPQTEVNTSKRPSPNEVMEALPSPPADFTAKPSTEDEIEFVTNSEVETPVEAEAELTSESEAMLPTESEEKVSFELEAKPPSSSKELSELPIEDADALTSDDQDDETIEKTKASRKSKEPEIPREDETEVGPTEIKEDRKPSEMAKPTRVPTEFEKGKKISICIPSRKGPCICKPQACPLNQFSVTVCPKAQSQLRASNASRKSDDPKFRVIEDRRESKEDPKARKMRWQRRSKTESTITSASIGSQTDRPRIGRDTTRKVDREKCYECPKVGEPSKRQRSKDHRGTAISVLDRMTCLGQEKDARSAVIAKVPDNKGHSRRGLPLYPEVARDKKLNDNNRGLSCDSCGKCIASKTSVKFEDGPSQKPITSLSVIDRLVQGSPTAPSDGTDEEFLCCECKTKAIELVRTKRSRLEREVRQDSCDQEECCVCATRKDDKDAGALGSTDRSRQQKPETKDQSCLVKISRDKGSKDGRKRDCSDSCVKFGTN